MDKVDAKLLYYAFAMDSALGGDGVRADVLGSLVPAADDTQLRGILRTARAIDMDLNDSGETDITDAVVFYYSFALAGALGDGSANTGLPAVKEALLGPLAGGRDIDAMLQHVHRLREGR